MMRLFGIALPFCDKYVRALYQPFYPTLPPKKGKSNIPKVTKNDKRTNLSPRPTKTHSFCIKDILYYPNYILRFTPFIAFKCENEAIFT